MNTRYPPVGFIAFVYKDLDLTRWTYVQRMPAIEFASDFLLQRCRNPQVLATELAQAILRSPSDDKERAVSAASCQSYGMALTKLGVAPFIVCIVQNGQVTSHFEIPACTALEAHAEFEDVIRGLEASEAP